MVRWKKTWRDAMGLLPTLLTTLSGTYVVGQLSPSTECCVSGKHLSFVKTSCFDHSRGCGVLSSSHSQCCYKRSGLHGKETEPVSKAKRRGKSPSF